MFMATTGKSFPDFSDKVVLLYLTNRSPDDAVVLCGTRFETQGGRFFIVGEYAEGTTANDWAAGIATAVSWDSVEQYLIFDSIEDYFNRASLAYNKESMH
jgi:hypothetical protein